MYRLRPTPQYIGQIRLKDVRAKDAVGVFVDKPKGQVLKGDLDFATTFIHETDRIVLQREEPDVMVSRTHTRPGDSNGSQASI